MKKILINCCYGGFGYSDELVKLWKERTGKHYDEEGNPLDWHNISREDIDAIAIFEEIGSKRASGFCGNLKVVEIPKEASYSIEEYDGYESITTYMHITEEELFEGISLDKIELLKKVDNIKIK